MSPADAEGIGSLNDSANTQTTAIMRTVKPPTFRRNRGTTAPQPKTLRDEFAAAALQGILACFKDHEGYTTVSLRVKKAYEYADEMLKQRNQ